MNQPKETEYILIREKQDPKTRKAEITIKRNVGVDLRDYKYFFTKSSSSTMDRYVHKDDYVEYVKMFQF
jgi:hypothetical protein